MSRISSIEEFMFTSGGGEISFYYTLLLVSALLPHPLPHSGLIEAPFIYCYGALNTGTIPDRVDPGGMNASWCFFRYGSNLML